MYPSPAINPPAPRLAAAGEWWHLFHQVQEDLPEALVYGRERLYLEFFYMNGCDVAGAIADASIIECARTFSFASGRRDVARRLILPRTLGRR